MAAPRIAELIAKKLAEGIEHPGDPKNGKPPMTMKMPLGRIAGASPQINELIDATVKLIAEAIVHLIETEGDSEIIPKAELQKLRATDEEDVA